MKEATFNINYIMPQSEQRAQFVVIRERVPVVKLMAQHLVALLSDDKEAEEEVYTLMRTNRWKETVMSLDDFRLRQAFETRRRGGFAHRYYVR